MGLSGGPDSMMLLHMLAQLRDKGVIKTLIAAHLDHEWRTDSKQDLLFCSDVSTKINVQFVSAKFSDFEHSIKDQGSKEAMARDARRIFFEQVRNEYKADLIALGHHLQDQEETFLIRLIRGTSSTGLCAMWPKNGCYIRPLLETSKANILAYLKASNIDYLTDPTNASADFLRNRIRNTVLPALHEADDRFDQNFLATLTRLQMTEQFLETLTEQTYEKLYIDTGISRTKLLAQPLIIQYRILMHFLCAHNVAFPPSQSFLDELLRFIKGPEGGSHTAHHGWKLIKKAQIISIIRNE